MICLSRLVESAAFKVHVRVGQRQKAAFREAQLTLHDTVCTRQGMLIKFLES